MNRRAERIARQERCYVLVGVFDIRDFRVLYRWELRNG